MRTIRWSLFGLVLLYLLTGVVQVRRGERGVVRRFGRVLDVTPEPGLWVGLPWGMDRVDRIEVDSVRSVTVGYVEDSASDLLMPAGQVLTGDHNLVNVQVVLYFKVRPEGVVDFALQADRVRDILGSATESVVAGWVAGKSVDEVLLTGKTALRSELLTGVRERIEPYALGVDVLDGRVSQIAPPDEVRDAFDSISRAQTQIATLRHGAEQTAAARLRGARAESFRIEQEAHGRAHATRVLARQETSRFRERLQQYQSARDKNPRYLEHLWREERGKLFATLKANGQIDLLDHRLGSEGLDLWSAPRLPRR